MTRIIDYLSTLLHLLGMLLLVGGHLWFAFASVFAERNGDQEGDDFLARFLPMMANTFGAGILLLFASGLTKLLLWGEKGLIFLPDPYGWLLFSKLLLYTIIVSQGLFIERRYLSAILRPGGSTAGLAEKEVAWRHLKRGARLNLLLILVVLALGEALRYARL